MTDLERLESLRAELKTLQSAIKVYEDSLIADAPERYEGVSHADGYDVTFRINRKIDWAEYDRIEEGLPTDLKCKCLKPALDLKKFRHLQAADPMLASVFCSEKPGKPSIKILKGE